MLRGSRTRLFHAVVGLGLAACGGAVIASSKDGGFDATSTDAARVDAAGGSDAAATSADASPGPVFTFDASSDALSAASDAAHDAPTFAPPVQ